MIYKIHNSETRYTVDMYQTFTSDHTEEYMLEQYNEACKPDTHTDTYIDTQLEYDHFDWNYNMQAVLKGLAEASIELIKEYADKAIIQNITVIGTDSPKEYNYSTDGYSMEIETTLETEAELIAYLDSIYSEGNYLAEMYDTSSELYYENTTMELIPVPTPTA